MTNADEKFSHTNRLANESSPYLLQHAHNPVAWYPWGPEAFAAARVQNKPIFLSVGYSTCYWCHVMERQSFENEAIAAEMNARFINIKVDREERPDVDQLYMTAVQVLTRHGGWPMSVFLTPDLRPFYGGTYFPPADMHGRPGFVSVLRGIEDAYKNRPADVEKTADQLVNILSQYARPAAPQEPIRIDMAFVEDLIRRSVSDYDPTRGGFGGAPKFPRETLLELLLVYLRTPDEERGMGGMGLRQAQSGHGPPMSSPASTTSAPAGSLPEGPTRTSAFPGVERRPQESENLKSQISKMIFHTLAALADGGIRDQLGGGFHRYSTDAHWLVPHFEIMLYDNAMLAWCYAEAFAQMNDPRYAAVARGVFDFVLREMTSPAGAFYTALDAEVDGQEGLNYLWTEEEITALLGPEDTGVFNTVYGVDGGPNFADPHHGSGIPEKNILYLPVALEKAAKNLKTDTAALESRLAPLRQKLYEARMKRKQPLLDTKIITSWNALMIRALAHGGRVLSEPRYTEAAARAADFLLQSHRTPEGGLFRASRDGQAKYRGFLDDYAFLLQALLTLHEATGTAKWKTHAVELADQMNAKFGGEAFYFTEKDAPDLILRQMTSSDSPLPSGNAVAAMALLELGDKAQAAGVLAEFAQQVESQGEGMSSMVQAALLFCRKSGAFTVSAYAESEEDSRPMTPTELAEGVVGAKAAWQSPTVVSVEVIIAPGYHINAYQVPADLSLIATRISAADDPAAEVDYPPGEELSVPFMDRPLQVYSGTIKIRVKFAEARESGKPLVLNLVYQACNDTSCLAPVTRQIKVEAP
ncbi:MAG TPA: DUF255 domain-containing protein [Tepidisphaeraceae bacterium]|jgi:hypothetical protein|nr:DUF255 domain-containing protein [Tepidisphaeraceae bacterium]